ncbi:acetylornithine aminotransferase [Salix suchowensis]|nr:acetylornithine aminotransferase [Salix suchowensis]
MSSSTLAEEAKPLPSSPCTKYKARTHIVSTPSTHTSEILDRSAKYSYRCPREQAGKLLHTSNVYHHEWAGKLAELLVTLTAKEGGLGFSAGQTHPSPPSAKVFFSNSGTEANEGALKVARKVGKERWAAVKPDRNWDDAACDKTRILCFEHSFHGRSMGALSVTSNPKYQKPFLPLIPGVDVGTFNDFASIEALITDQTCAVILEPIQGEGGIGVAQTEWLRQSARNATK